MTGDRGSIPELLPQHHLPAGDIGSIGYLVAYAAAEANLEPPDAASRVCAAIEARRQSSP
jgi:hypothetical protein